jgi:proline dehydrogenase
MTQTKVDFSNTQIAFKARNNKELQNSYLLFKSIGYNWLVQTGPKLVEFGFKLGLPIKGIIKKTVFHQFCGGESVSDCEKTIQQMHQFGVGTILDYSVEGEEQEEVFDATAKEVIKTIEKAENNLAIPFSVFKVTGVGRFTLLQKVNEKKPLTVDEIAEFDRVKARIHSICKRAFDLNVRLFIDAEESWIQDAIDGIVAEMMLEFNKKRAIIYNTIQFYRHDRLAFLKQSIENAKSGNYFYGVKLVRGAYMEKEALRAIEMGYANPIQPNKAASDKDYNEGLKVCLTHHDFVSICAGTHNQESCEYLMGLMEQFGLNPSDERIYFSQLYGMSDNLSYNLADAEYKVAKYLPYGPVRAVLPYLFRRAQENTSVQGQAGRELKLVIAELQRRKK